MKATHRFAGLLAVLSLMAGCGASLKTQAPSPTSEASPQPGTPSRAQESQLEGKGQDDDELEPTTLADAEALLERSRAELEGRALNAPPRDQVGSSTADAASGPPAKAAIDCESVCKAFASLSRAGDAICRLDTETGKRCQRARQIRDDATRRVASCGCA
jgi:hypothetical protein